MGHLRDMREGESVGAYLDALVGDGKVPGIQYVVVDEANVIFEYAGGWADLASRRPMDRATTLMAYSMSKTITAAAVLRLADEGALDLQDPVARYVDSVPSPSATLGQILTHTAGVPNPIPLRWVHLLAEHATFDEHAALARQLEKNRRRFSSPGRAYRYSNLGYWLLDPVVEATSVQPFAAYVAEHVLSPLGIPEAELSYTIPDLANHATGYLEKYSFLNLAKRLVVDGKFIGRYEGRWLEIVAHYVDGPAFGGLVGNALGFGKFLQDQLRPRPRLFGDDTRALFYRPARTTKEAEIPMTHGWHIGSLDGDRYFFKEGGGGGFHCMMRLYPERGVGTVAMTNATAFNVGALLDRLDRRAGRL
jgi:D-alanyl-D-alanine carboxypeptidase